MTLELATREDHSLQTSGGTSLPSLVVAAGENAAEKFIDYFTAQIRNPNTRRAYFQTACHFTS